MCSERVFDFRHLQSTIDSSNSLCVTHVLFRFSCKFNVMLKKGGENQGEVHFIFIHFSLFILRKHIEGKKNLIFNGAEGTMKVYTLAKNKIK